MEGTVTEQPADSIASDLEAAFSEYEAGDEVSSDTESMDEMGDVSSEVDSGADEDLSGDTSTEDEESEDTEDSGNEETSEEAIEPPQHWSEADKETFRNVPKEAQEFLLNRHKAMEADYTRKTQELADVRKSYEAIDQVMAPFQGQMQELGISQPEVIQRWAAAENYLNTNPAEAIQWLAQSYGVDLGNMPEQSQADPAVQKLQQELHELRQSVTQREQTEAQQRTSSMLDQIRTFADEKDEAGNAAHPYFEDVMDDMLTLARAEAVAGRTPVLNDLYEKAVWANPTVRDQMLSAQRKAAEKKAADEARAKAAAAKKASKSVSGSPSGKSAPSSDLGLRETLEQAYS